MTPSRKRTGPHRLPDKSYVIPDISLRFLMYGEPSDGRVKKRAVRTPRFGIVPAKPRRQYAALSSGFLVGNTRERHFGIRWRDSRRSRNRPNFVLPVPGAFFDVASWRCRRTGLNRPLRGRVTLLISVTCGGQLSSNLVEAPSATPRAFVKIQ